MFDNNITNKMIPALLFTKKAKQKPAAKKKKPKKKQVNEGITRAAMKRLASRVGAPRVAKDAYDDIERLYQLAVYDLGKSSMTIAVLSNRKTIKASDVREATRTLKWGKHAGESEETHLFAKAPFVRFLQDRFPGARFTAGAILLMMTIVEKQLEKELRGAVGLSAHAKRQTLMERDLEAQKTICNQ